MRRNPDHDECGTWVLTVTALALLFWLGGGISLLGSFGVAIVALAVMLLGLGLILGVCFLLEATVNRPKARAPREDA